MSPLPHFGRRLLGPLALAALLAPTGPATAHAVVVGSEPAAGASLDSPPRQVTIRFNSRIDHERSRVVLVGPEGVQYPLTLLSEGAPTVVEAALNPSAPVLAPGAWRLRWQVLAVDGHITRGDIPFTLQAR